MFFIVIYKEFYVEAYIYLRVIAALGGALVGIVLPGMFHVDVGYAKAAGSAGMFLLIFTVDPPALTSKNINDLVMSRGGYLTQGEADKHFVDLSKGDVLEVQPIISNANNDELYFDLAVVNARNNKTVCTIERWKGSSGALGNALLYRAEETERYMVRVSSRGETRGRYDLKIILDSEYQVAECGQINE